MKLFCKTCNLELSKTINELNDLSLINENDREDFVPEGFYLAFHDGTTYAEQIKDSIIINIKDLINSNYHSEQSRLNGCCGQDGLDGMNRVCSNNHEIGTEHSDCWMAHFIAINPKLVRLI